MIEIEDLQGTKHLLCPRCNSGWRWVQEPDYVACSGCTMKALEANYPKNRYCLCLVLEIEDQNYDIFWFENHCMINDLSSNKDSESHLPILSFDITISKLKKYLLFS